MNEQNKCVNKNSGLILKYSEHISFCSCYLHCCSNTKNTHTNPQSHCDFFLKSSSSFFLLHDSCLTALLFFIKSLNFFFIFFSYIFFHSFLSIALRIFDRFRINLEQNFKEPSLSIRFTQTLRDFE